MRSGTPCVLAAQKWGGRIVLVDGSPTANPRRRWTFEQLLEDAEQVARALVNKGITLGELGYHEQAFEAYNTALARDPVDSLNHST